MERPRTVMPSPKSAPREPVDVVFTERPQPAPQLPAVAELKGTEPATTARVYPVKIAKSILAITREIGRIAKRGENKFQGYSYARWDDIVERLSPLLADNGLILVQTEKSRHLIEENDKGSTLSIVYGFSFVNEDGDVWPEVEWTALARLRDQKGVTDDKAAAKCHTQAEKYFSIKQFKIRTGEAIDSDADGVDHQANQRQSEPKKVLKKDTRAMYVAMQSEMDAACTSPATLDAWACNADARFLALPPDWQASFRWLYEQKMIALRAGRTPDPCGEMLAQRWGDRHGGSMARGHAGIEERILNETRRVDDDADGVIWEENGERPATAADVIDHSDRGGVPAFLNRREPTARVEMPM